MLKNNEGQGGFEQKLDELAAQAAELEGKIKSLATELLTDAFVSRHTAYANATEMFRAGGFRTESTADFAAISEAELDAHVQAVSPFADWRGMLRAAAQEWVVGKLGL